MNTIHIALALSAVFLLSHSASGDHPGPQTTLDDDQTQAIIETCFLAFEEYYIYPDAVPAMKAYITSRSVEGAYEKIPDLLV
jgi:hypothetical protein